MHDESDDVSRLGRFSWFDLIPSVKWAVIVLVTAVLIWAWVPPAKGADFEVVNRLPPTFTVVNRVQPAPAGQASGVVLPHSPVTTPAPVYQLVTWYDAFGRSWQTWELIPKPMPARAVPVQQPFRGRAFDPDHQCNACGRSQYVVDRFLPSGRHVHRCVCGNEWEH